MKRNESEGNSECQHQGELVSSQSLKAPANRTSERRKISWSQQVCERNEYKSFAFVPLASKRIAHNEKGTEQSEYELRIGECCTAHSAYHRFRCPAVQQSIDTYRGDVHFTFSLNPFCLVGAPLVRCLCERATVRMPSTIDQKRRWKAMASQNTFRTKCTKSQSEWN